MKFLIFLISIAAATALESLTSTVTGGERGLKGARRSRNVAPFSDRSSKRSIDSSHREVTVFKKFYKKVQSFRTKIQIINGGDGTLTEESDGSSDVPSSSPSESSSSAPSISSSSSPSTMPSIAPFEKPSTIPSAAPFGKPSTIPSSMPLEKPSGKPSCAPSLSPTRQPSMAPSDFPSLTPSDEPSITPSDAPSMIPSDLPSAMPSDTPSATPKIWIDSIDGTVDEGFDRCVATESAIGAEEITILYAYRIELQPGTGALNATKAIEGLLQQSLLGIMCGSVSGVLAISPNPADVPGGKSCSCFPNSRITTQTYPLSLFVGIISCLWSSGR